MSYFPFVFFFSSCVLQLVCRCTNKVRIAHKRNIFTARTSKCWHVKMLCAARTQQTKIKLLLLMCELQSALKKNKACLKLWTAQTIFAAHVRASKLSKRNQQINPFSSDHSCLQVKSESCFWAWAQNKQTH